MAKKIWVKICNDCGYKNPEDASKCNSCGEELWKGNFLGLGKNNHIRKWACPKCSTLNFEENKTCASCLWKA